MKPVVAGEPSVEITSFLARRHALHQDRSEEVRQGEYHVVPGLVDSRPHTTPNSPNPEVPAPSHYAEAFWWVVPVPAALAASAAALVLHPTALAATALAVLVAVGLTLEAAIWRQFRRRWAGEAAGHPLDLPGSVHESLHVGLACALLVGAIIWKAVGLGYSWLSGLWTGLGLLAFYLLAWLVDRWIHG